MDMQIEINAGKGGVGKTTISVAVALHYSRTEKTAIIDSDGGHSVQRTLGLITPIKPNTITPVRDNLAVAIIEPAPFVGIRQAQYDEWAIERYLGQFPGDNGIIPLADMVNEFFGVPTDVHTLQKFITLVWMLAEMRELGYTRIVIDVEPTAGLQRLLLNARSTAATLEKLNGLGILRLTMIASQWPDIKAYLTSPYIKGAERYAARMRSVLDMLIKANYRIVCIPESSPVSQTFDVRKVIEGIRARPSAIVINNVRGEAHESAVIARLNEHKLLLIQIPHQPGLLDEDNPNRISSLLDIGSWISRPLE